MNDLVQKLRAAGKESFVYGDLMRQAADVVERKRGKWIKIKYRSICRDCSFRGFASWNFCPNCGADMRGEQDG